MTPTISRVQTISEVVFLSEFTLTLSQIYLLYLKVGLSFLTNNSKINVGHDEEICYGIINGENVFHGTKI